MEIVSRFGMLDPGEQFVYKQQKLVRSNWFRDWFKVCIGVAAQPLDY